MKNSSPNRYFYIFNLTKACRFIIINYGFIPLVVQFPIKTHNPQVIPISCLQIPESWHWCIGAISPNWVSCTGLLPTLKIINHTIMAHGTQTATKRLVYIGIKRRQLKLANISHTKHRVHKIPGIGPLSHKSAKHLLVYVQTRALVTKSKYSRVSSVWKYRRIHTLKIEMCIKVDKRFQRFYNILYPQVILEQSLDKFVICDKKYFIDLSLSIVDSSITGANAAHERTAGRGPDILNQL